MKNQIKSFWITMMIVGCTFCTSAQVTTKNALSLDKMESYSLEVTYDKTSHLIFPSAIRYVDLGSDYLIASKAEDAENVLRVKASVKEFETETNFSVITQEGHFYSFNVTYDSSPKVLTYDLLSMQKTVDKTTGKNVLFEELGKSSNLADLLLETIYKKDNRVIKHIGAKSFGLRFILKGIYIHNGKYYFHTQLVNRSNVPFLIDFINFKIVDKKTTKRTVVQERLLQPLRMYKPLTEINGKSTERNVFLLDQFTIDDEKVLRIEVFEKNGGRNQSFEIENVDLLRARLIKDTHLKF